MLVFDRSVPPGLATIQDTQRGLSCVTPRPGCPRAPFSPRQAAPAAPAAKVDDDDDDDDLFGDDEEEEAAKPAEKSRAEKMAEAKAAKDAKKKVDR